MGLLDDAAGFQQAQREERNRLQAAKEAEFSPWTSPWTLELRDFLVEQGVRRKPLYTQGRLSEPVAAPKLGRYRWTRTSEAEYFGDGWLLRGWQNDDGGFRQVDVALTEDGALWKLSSTYEKSLVSVDGGRYAEMANSGSHVIFYPNVKPEHRSGFTLISDYRLRRAASDRTDDQALRALVGVPIAAAVQAGQVNSDGWVVAEESQAIPDFHKLRYF